MLAGITVKNEEVRNLLRSIVENSEAAAGRVVVI